MSRRLSIVVLLTASLLLCLVAGCWNPFKPDKKDGGGGGQQELLPRTSPENVLYDLRVIYGDKDDVVNTHEDAHTWAEYYRTLFHSAPDTFKFYFIPQQEPPGYEIGWWGINEEVLSFETMLQKKADGAVDDIKLNWTINPSEPDDRLGHQGWRKIHVAGILLDVTQSDGMIYQVPGGTADFYFAPDPANAALWVITEWWDRPLPGGNSPPVNGSEEQTVPRAMTLSSGAAPQSQSLTWGAIKQLY